MSGVFLSYAKEDATTAQTIRDALDRAGFAVWWDRRIPPGKTWDDVIGTALNSADCVLVLWSKASVQSRWVREEAERAANRSCLIPVLIEQVEPPFGFGRIEAADLVSWNGDETHPEFVNLRSAISELLQAKGTVIAPPSEAQRLPSMPEGKGPHRKSVGKTAWAAGAAIAAVLLIGYFVLSQLQQKAEFVAADGAGAVPAEATASQGLEAPLLVSPADRTTFDHYPRTTTLEWEPVTGAATYAVQYLGLHPEEHCDTMPARAEEHAEIVADLTDTTYTFDFFGAQPGCWRVWAVDVEGAGGLSSPVGSPGTELEFAL